MVIPLMNIGEVAEVTIDARFAYGSLGLKNDENESASVPADSTVRKIIYLIQTYTLKLLYTYCRVEENKRLSESW